jgi:Porin subfamily
MIRKSAWLGSAVLLLATQAAQAADLPVKVRPVDYVKVCTVYGAGFYYIPGTDTCLKIGGYLRSDHVYGGGNQGQYYLSTASARFTRTDTRMYSFRARANLTVDFRTQSDYGTIRAYASMVAQESQGDRSGTGVGGILRAFIQFMGFTAGHAISNYDFMTPADYSYRPPSVYSGWTGDTGIDILAYTATLSNGLSASISLEDGGAARTNSLGTGHGKAVINASLPAQLGSAGNGTTVTNDAANAMQPDLVANVRSDQTWGAMQVMGALHNASGGYYANFAGEIGAAAGAPAPGSTIFGHPGEAWGWVVGTGVRIVDFLLPKDSFEAQINYSKGAIGYVLPMSRSTSYASDFVYGSSNSVAIGYAVDGVFTNGTGVELTQGWSVAAAYQHFWSPQWRTSVIGGFAQVNYDSTARGYLCSTQNTTPSSGVFGAISSTIANCNPNFSLVAASTRTAWTPHPLLDIGVDLIWNRVNTAFAGSTVTLSQQGARPGGFYQVQSLNDYILMMRLQKSVLP